MPDANSYLNLVEGNCDTANLVHHVLFGWMNLQMNARCHTQEDNIRLFLANLYNNDCFLICMNTYLEIASVTLHEGSTEIKTKNKCKYKRNRCILYYLDIQKESMASTNASETCLSLSKESSYKK